jgi:hypothetical protein
MLSAWTSAQHPLLLTADDSSGGLASLERRNPTLGWRISIAMNTSYWKESWIEK